MFTERLNRVLDALGARSTDIARCGGPDRTAVAHYTSGRRIPKAEGEAAGKLADGICGYAREESKIDSVLKLIRDTEQLSEQAIAGISFETLKGELLQWLYGEKSEEGNTDHSTSGAYGGVKSPENRGYASTRNKAAVEFGSRLDLAIKYARLSNVMLSHLINVDASLISRYRNGGRMPRANSELIPSLAAVLWQYICKNKEIGRLASKIGVKESDLDETAFRNWLFAPVFYDAADISATEQLLKAFDRYGSVKPAMKGASEISAAVLHAADMRNMNDDGAMQDDTSGDAPDVYYGNEGLRDAVIRFLTEAVREGASEIRLYSDQDMSWMISGDFAAIWTQLMTKVVSKGIRIRIIHNINRNFREMSNAIKLWLPLYITGMVEPYYLTGNQQAAFSHTMFICPGRFLVSACNLRGSEADGVYHFHTQTECLESFSAQFEKMIGRAEPLITFPENDSAGVGGARKSSGSKKTRNASDKSPNGKSAGNRRGVFPRELADTPFHNIRITIYEEYIEIASLTEGWKTFRFSNPVMYRAFLAYENHLKLPGAN